MSITVAYIFFFSFLSLQNKGAKKRNMTWTVNFHATKMKYKNNASLTKMAGI